ncbi:MAG TPA: hypothetical protein DEQ02_04325 [Ruminococcaceae bacterium]|nr:hypothetical protein [Oscillospiraceae bacterium]
MRKSIALLMILFIMLTLAACGGAGGDNGSGTVSLTDSTTSPAQSTNSQDVSSVPSETPVNLAPMNDAKTIFEGMEAMLGPVYEYYEENGLIYDQGKTHLAVPEDFSPDEPNTAAGKAMLEITYSTWIIEGNVQIFHAEGGDVEAVHVEIDDSEFYGGMANVYTMASAVYASSVKGMTPELGKKIADALHLNDSTFTMPGGKTDRILIHEGYYYFASKSEGSGWYTRIRVWPVSDADGEWNKSDEIIYFDIDGNDMTSS